MGKTLKDITTEIKNAVGKRRKLNGVIEEAICNLSDVMNDISNVKVLSKQIKENEEKISTQESEIEKLKEEIQRLDEEKMKEQTQAQILLQEDDFARSIHTILTNTFYFQNITFKYLYTSPVINTDIMNANFNYAPLVIVFHTTESKTFGMFSNLFFFSIFNGIFFPFYLKTGSLAFTKCEGNYISVNGVLYFKESEIILDKAIIDSTTEPSLFYLEHFTTQTDNVIKLQITNFHAWNLIFN
ncbi:hypothetical protein EIN_411400 [Entamoeba invadens IP1]|uniref:Uncharacterized protein n=1 Tax=Entamoeba invadens IP1 TaxID=370355 RepID=A0A0A1U161_ENTIV|nr:hypothetical protein EIN_411400 [Entamoeba invadens IP1]ELP87787.1 hypothetical protein EIN_411400 [Entamoeba invadens IP1]|eukprot:XP_004254558.1 hypothetical protein EIN_411400 [Entamoeba invadens IP1]